MFVVCGEALFDVFIEEGVPLTSTSLPFMAKVGGSPFNVAIGLARLNQASGLMTGLSNDFLGERLLQVLAAEGVSEKYLVRKQAPTTLGFIEKDETGQPNYAFYGEGAADRLVEEDDANIDLSVISGVHFGSYSTVVAPTSEAYLSLAKRVAALRAQPDSDHQPLITYDPNIRLNVEPNKALWEARINDYIKLADIIKISDEDMEAIYPSADFDAWANNCLEQGVKLVIITCGGEGVRLYSQQANIVAAVPNIKVADTVGAGDTFQTATIDAVLTLKQQNNDWAASLNTEGLQQLAHYASTAAAITCQRQGADLPSKEELVQALAESQ